MDKSQANRKRSSSGPVICLWLLAPLLAGYSAAGAAERMETLENAATLAEYAAYAASPTQLAAAREDLGRLTGDRKLGTLALYYQAYAEYRLGELALESSRGDAGEFLNACIEHLRDALKRDNTAEGRALLGACYGLKSAAKPLGMVWSMPQAELNLKKARDLDPDNPRVALLLGVREYNSPRALGGDIDEAIAYLERALELFAAAEDVESGQPDWGEAEAHAYLGRIYTEQNEVILARGQLEEALLLMPDYAWARNMLAALLATHAGN